jgi:hypothetical protein
MAQEELKARIDEQIAAANAVTSSPNPSEIVHDADSAELASLEKDWKQAKRRAGVARLIRLGSRSSQREQDVRAADEKYRGVGNAQAESRRGRIEAARREKATDQDIRELTGLPETPTAQEFLDDLPVDSDAPNN